MTISFGGAPGRIGDISSWDEVFCATKAKYILVTCVDSNRKPRELMGLRTLLQKAGIQFEILGDFLVLTRVGFLEALPLKGLFCGFDQVWFHESFPSEEEACKSSITSDGIDLSKELPEELASGFMRSSAILGLGDGCGLNVIAKRKEILNLIVNDVQED